MFSNCIIQPAHHNCNRWNSKNAGKPALTTLTHNGYMFGRLFDKAVRAHHVIWAMMTGKWPTKQIDHINGVRTDNRWCNLREVDPIQNSQNMRRPSDNTSGRIGVSRYRDGWQAYISVNRKRINLGQSFKTFEHAVAARQTAELKAGYHPNHGRAD